MDRRLVLGTAVLVLLAAGCGKSVGVQPADVEERIQRVENGLPVLTAQGLLLGKSRSIASGLEHYRVPGLSIAVINDYQVEWAQGYGVMEAGGAERVTQDTLFQIASISKALTAAAALHYVDAGDLQLDHNVNDVLVSWKVPENEYTAQSSVTLRRLLSHRAGVTVPGFFGYVRGDELPSLRQMLDGVSPANNQPVRVDVEPGTQMRYSGGGYLVVQQLLEDVTGEPFREIVQEAVLDPAGMSASTCAIPLPEGLSEIAASAHRASGAPAYGKWHLYPEVCPVWTTATDVALFAIEVMRAYRGEADTILSQEMASQMLKPHSSNGYGLGMFSFLRGRVFFHPGDNPPGYRAIMVALPRRGQGLVMMTNGANGDRLMTEVALSVAVAYGVLPPTPYLVMLGYVLSIALVLLLVIPVAYLVRRYRVRKLRAREQLAHDRGPARSARTAALLIVGAMIVLAIPYYAVLDNILRGMTALPEASRGSPAALALVEESLYDARRGEIEKAIGALSEAHETDPELEMTVSDWSDLCVLGSLWGRPADIIEVCDRGVAAVADYRRLLFGRGLARALTDDYAGAKADLGVYVEWTKDNGYYDPYGIETEGFVSELEAGRNPFDEATLDRWR